MKKLITSVLTLALVLCCFTFVGCKDKKEPKVATIEETLNILQQFADDMTACENKVSTQGYVYPIADAQAAATEVADTDKSSIGIEYSNYDDFDMDYVIDTDSWIGDITLGDYYYNGSYSEIFFMDGGINSIIDMYQDNNMQLNTVYKYNDGHSDEHIRITNNGSEIIILNASFQENNDIIDKYIINLNNNSQWVSFEYKCWCENGEEFYTYIEKSTDANRIINRYISIDHYNIPSHTTKQVYLYDFDEVTQKIIKVVEQAETLEGLAGQPAYTYYLSLNVESLAEINIDTENAIEIAVGE